MNPMPMLAGYNRWANERLYQVCANLSDPGYRQDRGAFFGSIHNTLNHLLVVDRLWLGRLIGQPTPEISGLDQILYSDFADLRAARSAEDERLVSIVGGLDEASLAASAEYRLTGGDPGAAPRHLILLTLFNHQTHHRGQIHTMLTQAGQSVPTLDIIFYPAARQHEA